MNAPKPTFTLLFLLLCSDISSHERVWSGHKTYFKSRKEKTSNACLKIYIYFPNTVQHFFFFSGQNFHRIMISGITEISTSAASKLCSLDTLIVASFPGHSQILFHSCMWRGEKPGEALVSILRHRLEMVDSVRNVDSFL